MGRHKQLFCSNPHTPHPLDDDNSNTIQKAGGTRECKKCKAAREAKKRSDKRKQKELIKQKVRNG